MPTEAILTRVPSRQRWLAELLPIAALAVATVAFFWPMLRPGPTRQFVVDGDFSRQFFPFRAFEAREWLSGRIPLWNPDMFAGHPFQADIQTGVFYPIAMLNAIIFGRHDFPYLALEGEIVLHTFLAAVFAYLLARKYTGSRPGSILGAIAFAFGGYMTSYPAQQLAVLETAVWLPLIVYFLELAVESAVRWRWLVAASAAFGVAILAGHPQTDLFFMYASEGYLLWRLIGARATWKKAIASLLVYPTLSAAIAAIQLVPTTAFLAQSSRVDMNYLQAAHGYLLAALPEVLVPLWHGEKALSIGIAAMFLAILGAVRSRREPIAYWTVVGLVALPLSTGGATPLFWLLYHAAPGWNLFRDQERVIVLFSFAAALLAARGVAEIERQWRNVGFVRTLQLLAAAAAALNAILFAIARPLGAEADLQMNFGLNALVLTGLALVLSIHQRVRGFRSAGSTALILLVLAETFAINAGNNLGPMLPDPRPRLAATAQFMRGLPEPFRMRAADENVFPSNYGTLLGTPTIGGDTPFTLRRMNELLHSDADWRIWQILNVKFYVSTGDALAGLSLVFQDGPLKTYKMGDSLPRAWAVNASEIAKSDGEARTMILAPGYHPGNIVVLEKSPSFGPVPPGPRPDVTIVQNDPQRVVIDAKSTSNSMLVLAVQYYPDWQLLRDGEPAEVFRANYLAMAAELPPGEHHFEFVYRPGPMYLGAGLSALGLIVLGLVTSSGALLRRRPRLAVGGRMSKPVWTAFAVVILASSFALRTHHLSVPVLTGDEWFMLRNHDEGIAWIVHQAHTFEPHPLIYYVGLAGWINLAGRTEFALRFPSVFAGVLLTAAAIGLGRRLISQRAGLFAGAVVALNPYQLAESQNARNYAPVTAASAIASLLFLRALSRGRRTDWIVYGLAMFVALNIHYDAALVLAVHAGFVLGRWLTTKLRSARDGGEGASVEPGFPRWWLMTTAVVSVGFGFWLLYAWPALAAYHGFFPTPVSLDRVLGRSLATFSLGTVASVRDASPVFALAIAGWIWLLLVGRSRAAFLALYVLLPIAAVGILFVARPMFDERYLIVLAPGYLLLVAAGLEATWSLTAPLGAIAVAGLIAYTVPSIPRTYNAEISSRGDYRSMATWVTAFGSPDDPIVATGYGQANLIAYYLGGRRSVVILDSPELVATQLPKIAVGHQGTWLLPYADSPSDVEAIAALDRDAVPVASRWFVNAPALYFGSATQLAPITPPSATWNDSLTLEGVDQSTRRLVSGEAATLALHLTAKQSEPTPKGSLRLLDETGHIIAQTDSPASTTVSIGPGSLVARIGVFVPSTTPPGEYRLALVFYQPSDGREWRLKTVSQTQDGALIVGRISVGVRASPVPLAETGFHLKGPTSVGSGLSLVGMDKLPPSLDVGSTLTFRLVWRAEGEHVADRTRSISLVTLAGAPVASATEPVSGAYLPSRWTAGQIFDDRVRLIIPAALPGGQYKLQLTASGSSAVIDLGSILVLGPQRDFQKPTVEHPVGARFSSFATLLGADVTSSPVAPGTPIRVVLTWSARATADRRYTAFVHLIGPDGNIAGQVDRGPVEGHRPTDGWVDGEYLRDSYEVSLAANAGPGAYQVEVGLYDAANGARAPVTLVDGSVSDHVIVGSVQAP